MKNNPCRISGFRLSIRSGLLIQPVIAQKKSLEGIKELNIKWFRLHTSTRVIAGLVSAVAVWISCTDGADHTTASVKEADTTQLPLQSRYAGSAACQSCHADIYQKHIRTTHFSATQAATRDEVLGSFKPGNNFYRYNASETIKCIDSNGRMYQQVYINGINKKQQPFDIIFGAGKNAQSYASWVGNRLVQLPLSYFSYIKKWNNSPGYPDKIVLNRVITSRCLECHTTNAKVIAVNGVFEDFDKSSVLYGVGCEKCHGPGMDHIKYETQHPHTQDTAHIINPKKFSRQQELDLCAVCHSGSMNKLQPAFSFMPGDRLSDYYLPNIVSAGAENLDVHGNQFGLLSLSKCFSKSTMTCNSCHDPHANEENQFQVFSQKCMRCHNEAGNSFCTLKEVRANPLKANCINCHMPVQPSKAIVFTEQGTGKRIPATMRTHLIKVYPQETAKLIRYINGNNTNFR